MDVIPVIDVARGRAVRGVRGDRASYQPLVSPLAKDAEPQSVAKGLRTLYPFRCLYLADLDGIEGRGRNVHLVPSISAAMPAAEIWIDAGTTSRGAARAVLAAPVATLVVGSETLEGLSQYRDIAAEAPSRMVLSLDFRGDEFMGPDALLADAGLWPARVIVMTLARVGSGEGPDLARLGEILRRAGARRVYAAGGIRDAADLRAVQAAGAAGVLIASALHDKKISAGDLREIAGR